MNRTFLLLLMMIATMQLVACGQDPTPFVSNDPSRVRAIEGSEFKQVILTEKAMERIGLETIPVDGLVIPYSAVIYDVEGNVWVYTNPQPLTFVRAPIVIDRIEGDQVFLSQELETDAPIVTVGAAQLYGVETGVSK